jgi:hypothetical protein
MDENSDRTTVDHLREFRAGDIDHSLNRRRHQWHVVLDGPAA